ncbi:trypsin-like peptidase domain-containing protein, partial [Candidatus Uhrbacteria bacterium]|nr:trypsin-like peptidase domain-containing protein [Candidatus Uhrbacteria bacterium]
TDVSGNVPHGVSIICGNIVGNDYVAISHGSGVIIGDNDIITNVHVITDEDGVSYLEWCVGGTAENSYSEPYYAFLLYPTEFARNDEYFDYVFMDAYNDDGTPYEFDSYAVAAKADSMVLSEDIVLMGFPASAGSTVTVTEGTISGYYGTNWIKTDAIADSGSSGGGAFDVAGNLFGIPTAVVEGDYNSYTYIQNINAIFEDAFGEDIAVRDYGTLYETENIFCLYDVCYQYAPDENTWAENLEVDEDVVDDDAEALIDEVEDDTEVEATEDEAAADDELVYTVPDHAVYAEASYDAAMQSRVKGYILLQVQQHGEAWYVHTQDGLRYYMRDGAIAYQMMRTFGLGITDADLEAIPAVDTVEEMRTATSVCSTNSLANRVKGQILLQVQQHGEAWYVHPDTCRRVYMKDGDVAYSTMRYLSLGITDGDLAKLPYSSELEIK